MEGLFTLLLFAGLFYVMMRYGCGAHMVHGHGGHGSHEGHSAGGPATDPVCGMTVAAGGAYAKMYGSREYRFCSRTCLNKFDARPDAYVSAA
jgi:YHS domain-containing protein